MWRLCLGHQYNCCLILELSEGICTSFPLNFQEISLKFPKIRKFLGRASAQRLHFNWQIKLQNLINFAHVHSAWIICQYLLSMQIWKQATQLFSHRPYRTTLSYSWDEHSSSLWARNFISSTYSTHSHFFTPITKDCFHEKHDWILHWIVLKLV